MGGDSAGGGWLRGDGVSVTLIKKFPANLNIPLHEISEATSIIYQEAGDKANIIFGAVIDQDLDDSIFVTVIATGFDTEGRAGLPPHQDTGSDKKYLDLPTYLREKDKPKAKPTQQTIPLQPEQTEESRHRNATAAGPGRRGYSHFPAQAD